MVLDTKAKIKIGLGVFVIGLTALTMNFLLKNIKKLVGLKFDYKDTDVNKINFKEISLTMNWKCTNPSDFNFTIKNQVYDVFLNDTFIGRNRSVWSWNFYCANKYLHYNARSIKIGC